MVKHKSVLITGCSAGGIGDALAQSFHSHGFRVFATARNLSKVAHLKELGIDVIELDVTNEESVKKAAETVSAATQKTLDILVNNSGSSMYNTNSAEFLEVLIQFSILNAASRHRYLNRPSDV
jgi:NADP-dependent 3-hydroxy acid dehydrogenase YdfG